MRTLTNSLLCCHQPGHHRFGGGWYNGSGIGYGGYDCGLLRVSHYFDFTTNNLNQTKLMKAPKLAYHVKSPAPPTIPPEYETNSVEHRYSGNGWAVVQVLEDENVRVVSAHNIKQNSQIFLAWNKCIKLEKKRDRDESGNWIVTDENVLIKDTHISVLNDLRTKLASGEYVVKDTRLVKVTP